LNFRSVEFKTTSFALQLKLNQKFSVQWEKKMNAISMRDQYLYAKEKPLFEDRRKNSTHVTPIKEKRKCQFSDSNNWYLKVSITPNESS